MGAFVAFAGFVFIMRFRRSIKARAAPKPSEPAFDLAEIRTLLDAEKITQAEHDRLRAIFLKQRDRDKTPDILGHRGFDVLPQQSDQQKKPNHE
jgi:hypothetical protein